MSGQILRLTDLIKYTGLSRSVIYDRMDPKSPRYASDFPKSFPLGARAKGWFKSDIDAWLAKCSVVHQPIGEVRHGPLHANSPTEQRQSSKANVEKSMVSRSNPAVTHGNLVSTIIKGQLTRQRYEHFLKLDRWTPLIAALLSVGISPDDVGSKLNFAKDHTSMDGTPITAGDARLHEARIMLGKIEQGMTPEEFQEIAKPINFLIWCEENKTHTPWLRYMLQLTGNEDTTLSDSFALKMTSF